MDNPYTKGTVDWYKEEIRTLTPQVNQRIVEANESGNRAPQVDAMIERLQKYGGTNKRFGEDVIGLGFSGKTKSRLKRQYQELKRVLRIDVWTPQGIAEYEKNEQDTYESFAKSHKGWSKDKWRDFVQMMGTVSSEMLREFGYERHGNDRGSKTVSANKSQGPNEDFIAAFEEGYSKGKDMEKLMEEVSKHTSGLDQRRSMDLLYKAIREDINNIDWEAERQKAQAEMQEEDDGAI